MSVRSSSRRGYRRRVTDTATGTVNEYGNEAGVAALAVTDTMAFPGLCD